MLPSPPSEMNYPPTCKRKRSEIEAEERQNQSFTVTSLVTDSPWTFEPLSRLLRAHLPLSWLAPMCSTVTNDIHPGSLVQGHITSVASWDYAVLIARRAPNGGLVAFEKIEDTYFVAYPLQPFVSEKWVQDAAIGASPPVGLQMMLHYLPTPDSDPKVDVKITPAPTSEVALSIPKTRRGAAARLSILSLPEKTEDSVHSPKDDDLAMSGGSMLASTTLEECEPISDSVALGLCDAAVEASVMPVEAHTDMLSPVYLRQRYQDHLYMTKTSLAYYTKGPLSRARARARAQDSSMTLTDLAAFYRDSLLPVKRMDLKYKQSIPHLIHNFQLHTAEDIIKSTRKTRLGKDGLWPIEHDFVLRWWKTRSSKQSASSDDRSPEIRDAVASLRMREAQMQMVLMLEALSIETKQKDTTSKAELIPEVADVKVESVDHQEILETSKTKRKKQRNLETDLEFLADRLCIWHSVGLEGSTLLAEGTGTSEEDQTDSKDRLRRFCADVLIPFYSSKLPLLCKSLCKTLAGPEIFEQAQKASRLRDISKATIPGAVVRRLPTPSTGRELERVVSEEGIRHPSPPALARSSTLPPLPKFQREASELAQRPSSRSSRQSSISLINREIDLVADAQATASKKRKLDRVASHKQDLAAAIEALKKPNRRNVSGAYMDEVEKRKPEIRPNAVQITATPRLNRRTRLDDTEVGSLVQPIFENQAILSSGVKPNGAGVVSNVARSSSKKKAVLAAIHDTPSKKASLRPDQGSSTEKLSAGTDCNRLTAARDAYVLSTPSKPRSKQTGMSTNTLAMSYIDSSSKQGNIFELPDVAVKAMDRAMTMPIASTIYDTLGWNDDDDI